MERRIFEGIMAVLLLISVYFLAEESAQQVATAQEREFVVIVDAGHGGADPGKVAADGCMEKDINLSIAQKLKEKLEENAIHVVMTRETDEMLTDAYGEADKMTDMKKRCEIINMSNADCAVSIHQNSFSDTDVCGAQVFYHTDSIKGQAFAKIMQQQLKEALDPSNMRMCKDNTSYYLLRKTKVPLIIVECGFLTNPKECTKLQDEDYQDTVAAAIRAGIVEYMEQQKI